ncbi:MAG: hypothetical protein JNM82_03285 [Rhodocyclaceae bacterium]|nr:hypothetical protein [Rhodocyclaceae bacterium]
MNGDMPRDEGLSRLYREAAAEEPSPDLDRRILDAARQAVVPPLLRPRPWWMRWGAQAGLAATVVLTVMVTLLAEREHGDLMPGRRAEPAIAGSAPAPGIQSPAAPATASGPARPEPSQGPGATGATAPAAVPGPQSALRQDRVPAAPAADLSRTAPANEADRPDHAVGSAPAQAATTGRLVGDARERPASAPTRDAAPPPTMQAAPAAPAAAPAAAPGTAPAPMLKAVPAEAGKEMPVRSEEGAISAPARKAADRASAAEGHLRDPAAWLEDIRRLLRDGREAEARDQLAAFRRAYPGHPVPEDLR